MNAKIIGLFLTAALLVGAGWALAQDQDPRQAKRGDKGKATDGRYQIIAIEKFGGMLLDTATGQTWLLGDGPNAEHRIVWVPMKRFDDAKEYVRWVRDEHDRLQRQITEPKTTTKETGDTEKKSP
jgi:hypothetical protein